MTTITSVTSGPWSDPLTWDSGYVPTVGDDVVISAGHSVRMDVDYSPGAGIARLIISGSDTGDPGMLYCCNGSSGYLKMTSTIWDGEGLFRGTAHAHKGRLLINSDGVWGNTGPLAYQYRAFFEFCSSQAYIREDNLEIQMYCDAPPVRYLRAYGEKYPFDPAIDCDPELGTIDLHVAPPPVGEIVTFVAASGQLPAGIEEEVLYRVRSVDGTKITFTWQSLDYLGESASPIRPRALSAANCFMLTKIPAGSAHLNTLEDVSADPWWEVGALGGVVVTQCPPFWPYSWITDLAEVSSSAVDISAPLTRDFQGGARIWLSWRNIMLIASPPGGVITQNNTPAANPGVRVYDGGFWGRAIGYETKGAGPRVGDGAVINGICVGLAAAVSTVSSGAPSPVDGVPFAGVVVNADLVGCYSALGSTNPGSAYATVNGTVAGCSSLGLSSVAVTFNGDVLGGDNGIQNGSGVTFNGDLKNIRSLATRCYRVQLYGEASNLQDYGLDYCTEVLVAGAINGTRTAFSKCPSFLLTGALRGVKTPFTWGVDNNYCLGVRGVCRGAELPDITEAEFFTAGSSKVRPVYTGQEIGMENCTGVPYSQVTYQPYGRTNKNEVVTRSGGAPTTIECVPYPACSAIGLIKLFEWNEPEVLPGVISRSIWVMATGWERLPTGRQLYLVAEYVGAGDHGRRSTTSAAVITANDTWTEFAVSMTTTGQGTINYTAYLGAYNAGAELYVDAQLYG